jgi:hypothetical protein
MAAMALANLSSNMETQGKMLAEGVLQPVQVALIGLTVVFHEATRPCWMCCCSFFFSTS